MRAAFVNLSAASVHLCSTRSAAASHAERLRERVGPFSVKRAPRTISTGSGAKTTHGFHAAHPSGAPVFTGPLKDQSGAVKVPAGKTLTDPELQRLNWYVEGVDGTLPK